VELTWWPWRWLVVVERGYERRRRRKGGVNKRSGGER
jgi:hypothetical protein